MFKKVMEALDRLSKSGKTPADELEELTKALQADLGTEILLLKSEDDKSRFVDSGDGKCKHEEGGKCCLSGGECCYCKDGKCCHSSMKKSVDEAEEAEALRKAQEAKEAEEAEALRKAQEDLEAEEALRKAQEQEQNEMLVEASEAYADLQKSVEAGTEAMMGEIETLKKSLGALLNLNIKLATAFGDMMKSRQEDMADLKKSIGSFGAAPLAPNAARIGTGSAVEGEEGELKKSTIEIQEALQKAVQDGKVEAFYLSSFGTYKDVNRLPQEVRDIIEV